MIPRFLPSVELFSTIESISTSLNLVGKRPTLLTDHAFGTRVCNPLKPSYAMVPDTHYFNDNTCIAEKVLRHWALIYQY